MPIATTVINGTSYRYEYAEYLQAMRLNVATLRTVLHPHNIPNVTALTKSELATIVAATRTSR